MKKFVLLLCALLFALGLSACAAAPGGASPSSDSASVTPPPAEPSLEEDPWGIAFSVKDVTSTGCTLVCTQSGGTPTGELNTGTPYWLQVWKDGQWQAVEEVPSEYERIWTSEAWIITMDGITQWEVNWEWIYGSLPGGTYRIGKTVLDWREPGAYDEQVYYAQFEIAG